MILIPTFKHVLLGLAS